ncbi:hypothetical protein [Pelobacter propionicus]|uniref:Uncharacterized protein n=1 Tax=Pelobacter propionicus (strain DSM 2379 / NBRC 103807 / OttBd1) TaxID=338966 RepID=A1AKC6_PELPD|nr:hypothetical protein [Pelobacter propionicus]ABK97796.1 hypothetical protein Ppro_0160 [Pelobacter propionicus DSM 2379]
MGPYSKHKNDRERGKHSPSHFPVKDGSPGKERPAPSGSSCHALASKFFEMGWLEEKLQWVRQIAVGLQNQMAQLQSKLEKQSLEFSQERNGFEDLKAGLESKLQEKEQEIAWVRGALEDKDDMIQYWKDRSSDSLISENVKLKGHVDRVNEENNAKNRKAVLAVHQIEGDVASFAECFLGLKLEPYPAADQVSLTSGTPEAMRYDLMGVIIPAESTLNFRVAQRGWCEADGGRIWVEARLSVVGE